MRNLRTRAAGSCGTDAEHTPEGGGQAMVGFLWATDERERSTADAGGVRGTALG